MKHSHRTAAAGGRRAAPAKTPPASTDLAGPGDALEVRIREAAYFRYLARGAEVGRELEDWLQAEADLLESDNEDGPSH
jgi:hypothetical protein